VTHSQTTFDALSERARFLQADGRFVEAADTLLALVEKAPDSFPYCARLATLLDGMGQTEAAIDRYLRLLARQPELAAAHFNLALLLKKQKQFKDAMAAYDQSVRLGIDRVEEVYTNMGVLYSEMHRGDKARELYARALRTDPEYIPALFNLAGLFEEAGEREQATALYDKILSLDPQHWDSLARLAHARRLDSREDPLISSLRDAVSTGVDDRLAHEGLYFALGKVLDEVGAYDEAIAVYQSANELGKLRNPAYDRIAAEKAFDQLIGWCGTDWIENAATSSTDSPIFICGMFRSGSTLSEQVLAAHPSVAAGGEMDILPWLVSRRLAPYPQGVQSASCEDLKRLADEYVSRRGDLIPGAKHVTDKRPENYLHLGLIKALFPAARIVTMRREPLDNCLSVYFQQLGDNLSYATDLGNIAHYYKLQERLMRHWQSCMGENIFVLDYDDLVRSPEPVLRKLLDYLGLDWDDRCLGFEQTENLVKTASVWQVREALHQRSSGRWRNYEASIGELCTLFQ